MKTICLYFLCLNIDEFHQHGERDFAVVEEGLLFGIPKGSISIIIIMIIVSIGPCSFCLL